MIQLKICFSIVTLVCAIHLWGKKKMALLPSSQWHTVRFYALISVNLIPWRIYCCKILAHQVPFYAGPCSSAPCKSLVLLMGDQEIWFLHESFLGFKRFRDFGCLLTTFDFLDHSLVMPILMILDFISVYRPHPKDHVPQFEKSWMAYCGFWWAQLVDTRV